MLKLKEDELLLLITKEESDKRVEVFDANNLSMEELGELIYKALDESDYILIVFGDARQDWKEI
ncbi:MAG: hypothetical protein QW270_06665 [Candidatus Bathyarchaeia archaeon]